jgi:glutamate-1-semialdehyde 2,1-aminomutase
MPSSTRPARESVDANWQEVRGAEAMRNLSLQAAVADAEARYVAANPKSKARFEAAARDMPGGNTRTVLHYDPFPVALVKGEGAHLTDLDGHTYIDFLGEFTAGLYGHSEPAVLRAIREALDGGLVLGGPNRYEARLAELMCARFPALELVRFCNSGSEATLMCLSLARAVTGRTRVMACNGAYHGGFLSFAGSGSPINAPFPYVMADYNDTEGVRHLIGQHAQDLAAIIVEPLMGSGGCIPADASFLRVLREEADRHGIVLVFDEVMTSRLAPGGLHGKLGVYPDLVAFGKYLGGGVTFGAFGGKRTLMQRLDPTRPDGLTHSGTYNNNVLTMAAGIAGLEKVYTAEAAERLNASGDRLRAKLNATAERHGAPVQVLGQGSMLCFHPQHGTIRRPADCAGASPDLRKLLHLELNLRGIYIARRGFMSLSLPLTDADHDALVAAFDAYLSDYSAVLAQSG